MTRRSVGLQNRYSWTVRLAAVGALGLLAVMPARLAAQQQTVHQTLVVRAHVAPVSELVSVSPLHPQSAGADQFALSGTVGVLSNQPFRLEVRLVSSQADVRVMMLDGGETALTTDQWVPVARGVAGLDVVNAVEYHVGKVAGRPAIPQVEYRIVADQPESLALSR